MVWSYIFRGRRVGWFGAIYSEVEGLDGLELYIPRRVGWFGAIYSEVEGLDGLELNIPREKVCISWSIVWRRQGFILSQVSCFLVLLDNK